MADKKISELDQTLDLNDQADFPLSQDNGGEPTTFRAKLTQIATKIAEAITFSNLKTGNKQLVSAVNQTISNLADDFNTTAGSTYAKDDCVLYNGVLYQCINNSGTTSGTFIDADWTAIKAVDVGSGGGGGGGAGGHTIVDDAGTSLTQRTNLQFKGAYSEDNSTDDTTEVNVVREMTKAEFDELTEAEKTGFINITDITGGNDDRFQPVIYSTEEREIGVWTDGKPLYQKTYEIDVSTLVAVSDWTTIDSTINGETMAGMEISVKSYNDYSSRSIAFRTDYVDPIPRFTIIQGAFKYFTDSSTFPFNNYVWTITLRYTKTTDTAGSGQWTPQGVPAHHYSEDEQVVGTWIDGKTLYEKTVDCGALPDNSQKQVAHGISNIDKIVDVVGIAYSTSLGTAIQLAYPSSNSTFAVDMSVNNTTIVFLTFTDRTSFNGYVTIRYTKSV